MISEDKRRISVVVNKKDWEYLEEVSRVMGVNVSFLVRDLISDLVENMRLAIGEGDHIEAIDKKTAIKRFLSSVSEMFSEISSMMTR